MFKFFFFCTKNTSYFEGFPFMLKIHHITEKDFKVFRHVLKIRNRIFQKYIMLFMLFMLLSRKLTIKKPVLITTKLSLNILKKICQNLKTCLNNLFLPHTT